MREQYDIAPKRKQLGLTQREVEAELNIRANPLSVIEDGRLGIDTETYDRIHAAMATLAQKREMRECDEKPLTSALS